MQVGTWTDINSLLAKGFAGHQSGDRVTAAACYQAVLAQAPTQPDALNLLGLLLLEENRHSEAAHLIDVALAQAPQHPYALLNRATLRRAAGLADGAEADARAALALLPNHPAPHHILGNLLLDRGEPAAALAELAHARRLDPANAEIELAEAMALLALGRWQDGWRAFEARWRTAMFQHYPTGLQPPHWDGSPLRGPLVLVAEQGFGDGLQFIRYAAAARARADATVVVAQPPLHRLFQRVEGVDHVQGFDAPLPPGAMVVGLMSLPGRLHQPDPQPVPAYLSAATEEVAAWQALLPEESRPRVGLCWHGMARSDQPLAMQIDRRRSLRFDHVQPLLGLDQFAWIALQTDPPDDLIDTLLPPPPRPVRDFADTAALMAGLDLVVTVDTAVSHLAGGLGRPTVLLNRFGGCWRWEGEGRTSWYPTLRVITQRAEERWDDTVARLIRGLRSWQPGHPLPEVWP